MEPEERFFLIKIFFVGLVGLIALGGFIIAGADLLFIGLLVLVVTCVVAYQKFSKEKDLV